ncbi:DUF2399 domain-containing protein [Streptomyces sp. WP-1]|uniref:DUF2399 domain-containing protein n=1 Tax=Streptomyces sp. WP-1 TaxID=3041497 RepID=UPI00351B6836
MIIRRYGAQPWRMGGEHYEHLAARTATPRAAARRPARQRGLDPDLASAMSAPGVALHEEVTFDLLVNDLSGRTQGHLGTRGGLRVQGGSPSAGSHRGADPLPEPLPSHAATTDPILPTCGNAIEAGRLSARTSFGTKRSWVQIPPPRQLKYQVRGLIRLVGRALEWFLEVADWPPDRGGMIWPARSRWPRVLVRTRAGCSLTRSRSGCRGVLWIPGRRGPGACGEGR